jgi:hypothetical protein
MCEVSELSELSPVRAAFPPVWSCGASALAKAAKVGKLEALRLLIDELEQHGADVGGGHRVRQETRSSASSETRNTSSRMMRSVASFR